jgi:hypothetical protein
VDQTAQKIGRDKSEFSGISRYLAFNLNPERPKRRVMREVVNYILSPSFPRQYWWCASEKAILLFLRDGTSSKYMFADLMSLQNIH